MLTASARFSPCNNSHKSIPPFVIKNIDQTEFHSHDSTTIAQQMSSNNAAKTDLPISTASVAVQASPDLPTLCNSSQVTNTAKEYPSPFNSAPKLPSPTGKIGGPETPDFVPGAFYNSQLHKASHFEQSRPSESLSEHENMFATHEIPPKGEPDACLFVASLNAQRTDDQLMESVNKHFVRWGQIMNAKVMRDWMNRPYAFVQYKNVAHAHKALEESHDTVVDGRHIRVEQARVNRTLCITKLPTERTETELSDYFSKWGRIDSVRLLVNHSTGRSRGCAFVKYHYREDAIRAYLHIREQNKWAVEWAANTERPTNEIDRHNLFIGQLNPAKVTRELLEAQFSQYGKIESVHLVNKNEEAFAFLRFEEKNSAQRAIDAQNGKVFLGRVIRVQFREVPDSRAGKKTSASAFRNSNNQQSNSTKAASSQGTESDAPLSEHYTLAASSSKAALKDMAERPYPKRFDYPAACANLPQNYVPIYSPPLSSHSHVETLAMPQLASKMYPSQHYHPISSYPTPQYPPSTNICSFPGDPSYMAMAPPGFSTSESIPHSSADSVWFSYPQELTYLPPPGMATQMYDGNGSKVEQ